MKQQTIQIGGISVPVMEMEAVVIGSGCAAFNAADCLYDLGCKETAIVTEGVNMGTSRNTGSDKQTYYKLSLGGEGLDSVPQMARDLFSGGGMNGDTAWAEAACSAKSFFKLARLGVPFPCNEYGEYVGYQTDHDTKGRATSAGPLTSKFMTECLERSVRCKNIPILDGMTAFQFLTKDGELEGVLCLNRARLEEPCHGLTLLRTRKAVMATGGPAGCYEASVYPESQTGMSGMALEAGACGANLNEWQYGLASVKFRWNVSGSYQQVLPRYLSVDKQGVEREFLRETLDDSKIWDLTFLKGYQWPFDSRKLSGSSRVDLLVYYETECLGNREYLDFRRNPTGLDAHFTGLGTEARTYLERSVALADSPVQRLERLNPPAIQLYKAHGIDLYREPLEIRVCAQHHNGGIAVDADWQTSVRGLYVAGEAAGTFGAARPGGSALNSTQVGSLRAAEHIARTVGETTPGALSVEAENTLAQWLVKLEGFLSGPGQDPLAARREFSHEMSVCAAQIRCVPQMERLLARLEKKIGSFDRECRVNSPYQLPELLKSRDIWLTQAAVLSAMLYAAKGGSHGGAVVLQGEGGLAQCLAGEAPPAAEIQADLVTRTQKKSGAWQSDAMPVRPLPNPDQWFETVWEAYRKRTGGA